MSKTFLGVFEKKSEFPFLPKTPKTVLLVTQQPNITQRPFCIQNELSPHIKTITVAFLQAEL